MSRSRRPGPTVRLRVDEITVVGRATSDPTGLPGDVGPDSPAHPGVEVARHEDRLTTEEPLEIRLEWPGRSPERATVTMRTPGHDFELSVGWLLHEGLLQRDDLRSVVYCTDRTLTPEEEFNVVTVRLAAPPLRPVPERYGGVTAGSAACGVCGKQSIGDALVTARSPAADHHPVVPPELLVTLPDRMRDHQRIFGLTGGLHAAGLFDADGTPLVVREDVGRHNAVDKVVGARVLAGQPSAVPVLCLSGRIGFELVQKAVAAGVGAIVAVGAPSSLAVRLAAEAGVGLAGFVRDGRAVVYAAPERFGV